MNKNKHGCRFTVHWWFPAQPYQAFPFVGLTLPCSLPYADFTTGTHQLDSSTVLGKQLLMQPSGRVDLHAPQASGSQDLGLLGIAMEPYGRVWWIAYSHVTVMSVKYASPP
jgi:hypothetical protein